ncbi:MAG TPA: hypothetical protein VGS08_05750 [Candidatus Saccharimonadales bacterium]|nr:hypothetical protein [Candidatus Saccharimonadales bacterium]
MRIADDFNGSPDQHWTQVLAGGAYAELKNSVLRLGYEKAAPDNYTDAQIDDYTMLGRKDYLWWPPLRMIVQARFSHNAATPDATEATKNVLRGTTGFGFWNKPFTMQGHWFTKPQAVWFFYSAPPSDIALVPGVPGWGWKAQVINTTSTSIAANALPAAIAAGYGRLVNTQPAGHAVRRLAGAHEKIITKNMKDWHTYTLEWRKHETLFWVDNALLYKTDTAPTKPLGFVAWLDNEYAVVTPQGELQFGKTTCGKQWLDIDSVTIKHI